MTFDEAALTQMNRADCLRIAALFMDLAIWKRRQGDWSSPASSPPKHQLAVSAPYQEAETQP